MLSWLRDNGCRLNPYCLHTSAAAGGSVALLTWLQEEEGYQYNDSTLLAAAQHGRLDACKFLFALDSCGHNDEVVTAACHGGHFETVKWLLEAGAAYSYSGVYTSAAYSGSVELMEYLLKDAEADLAETDYTLPQMLTRMLAQAGAGSRANLAAVQWLRQQGAAWPTKLSDADEQSVWSGEVLAWARKQGCTAPVPEIWEEPEYDSDASYPGHRSGEYDEYRSQGYYTREEWEDGMYSPPDSQDGDWDE
jgi:Ankyrin repeats (many copies)